MRHWIAALLLILTLAPALAQAPPAVPAEPDSERRTTYTVTTSSATLNVGFNIYGDGTDYAQWVEVWLNGEQLTAGTDFTVTSPSGSLSTRPRPITNAQVNLLAVTTGTVDIVGARRPRRTSQFSESRGVTARDLNQVFSDLTTTLRERWDRFTTLLRVPPGDTLAVLPPAAERSSSVLGFDGSGQPRLFNPDLGLGNVLGPTSSVDGQIAVFDGTSGRLLRDGGGSVGTVTSVTCSTGLSGGTITGIGSCSLDVPVAATLGGTGMTSGLTGGVVFFDRFNHLASSQPLTADRLVIGGGANGPNALGYAGTANTVLHGNASGPPTFSAVSLTGDVIGTLPAASGGTGLASGNTGGINYWDSATSMSATPALTQSRILLGGGSGAPRALDTSGSTTTVLHGHASGDPKFYAVSLTADVVDTLGLANGGTAATTSAQAIINVGGLSLNAKRQSFQGGAIISAYNLGSSAFTVDCGLGPLQYATNNATPFTITAPTADGQCIVLFTNGASAGTYTPTGFSTGTSTGATVNLTNTNKFSFFFWRVNGTASFSVTAHQP